MGANGFGADAQPVADLPIAQPVRKCLQDLSLSRREAREASPRLAFLLAPLMQLTHKFEDLSRAEQAFAR